MAASGTMHEEARLGVLDGLRGIAVLLVLWYHVWEISWLQAPVPWLEFVPETGFVGVHLFFFLSGFVITYPFVRAALTGGAAPTWGHFAWRRFVKIVPSYVLSIGVAYALGYAQMQPNAAALPDIVSHLLFIHTWFPDRYGAINGVLWTLSVEVEFYLIFPLVWWCFKRRPWLTAGAMIALAWAWRAWFATCCHSTLFGQYEENLPGYLDIFSCGMLSAYLFTRFGARVRGSRSRNLAPLVALGGIVFAIALLQNLFAYRNADMWASVWQIDKRPLLGAAFALVALGSLASPRWWQVLLDNAPLRFLAIISYNLYLYHQMLARELLRWHVPPYAGDPHSDRVWQVRYTEVAFCATILQAALFTYLFERPIMRLRPPRPRIRAGGALSATWASKENAGRASSKQRSR